MGATAGQDVGTDRYATLFLCGDVMPGRGVDQALPYPCDPVLYEPYVRDARQYVELAVAANGPIPRPVEFSYIWGDTLEELEAWAPDVRLINLETSVTRSSDYWAGKSIHYRMSPENAACLTAAKIDCCVLANNHVLDWGGPGLLDTLKTLGRVGITTVGAGRNADEAARPAALKVPAKRRILAFGFGTPSSGIPDDWAATEARPGINWLPDLSEGTAERVADQIRTQRQPGDLVVVSIHWGANWGYEIPQAQREFAYRLIDAGMADVVHGHSCHHPKGIEVHRAKPILYGCGDFLNDYEGISGYEKFRAELVLAYFVVVDATSGNLARLAMVPFRTRRFRLERVKGEDVEWLQKVLDRESRKLGTRVHLTAEGTLTLRW
jgi:poly-gamma-glutamate capsule biosynthesis protein CapA/YwtB (metallophosphatase superfamily)